MELQKFGMKFWVEDGAALKMDDFITIFHRWIQQQALPDHVMIDVADYRHVHHGPGILLACHEANLYMDQAGGRLGLLYMRKQSLAGSFAERLTSTLGATLEGCRRLEQEPEVQGKLKFRYNEFLFIANDRLLAPNKDITAAALQEELSQALSGLRPEAGFKLSRQGEAKDRLAFLAQSECDLSRQ